MPILHTIASNPHPPRQKIAFSRSRFQPWRLRDNTSCTRRSAVSTPTPMTPAKRLTIAFEPSAGSFSRRSTGLFDPIDLLSDYEDYTWDRLALLQWRLRKLELKAGHPSRRGGRQKGSAAAYSNKSVRDSERETIANCRGRIPPLHRDLETAIAKGALGRHKEGATIIGCAIGLEPRPCSLPRGRPSRHSVT